MTSGWYLTMVLNSFFPCSADKALSLPPVVKSSTTSTCRDFLCSSVNSSNLTVPSCPFLTIAFLPSVKTISVFPSSKILVEDTLTLLPSSTFIVLPSVNLTVFVVPDLVTDATFTGLPVSPFKPCFPLCTVTSGLPLLKLIIVFPDESYLLPVLYPHWQYWQQSQQQQRRTYHRYKPHHLHGLLHTFPYQKGKHVRQLLYQERKHL